MSRITLTDSTQDAFVKMSNGNPGALSALFALSQVKTNSPLGGFGNILLLDTYGIYGTDIYVLFSDICDRDPIKMVNVLSATQRGKFSSRILKDACSRQDRTGKALIPNDILEGV